MDWLKELLKNAGVENVDELEKSISKEIPKHFKPAKEFNDINDELKTVKAEKTTNKKSRMSTKNSKKVQLVKLITKLKRKRLKITQKSN